MKMVFLVQINKILVGLAAVVSGISVKSCLATSINLLHYLELCKANVRCVHPAHLPQISPIKPPTVQRLSHLYALALCNISLEYRYILRAIFDIKFCLQFVTWYYISWTCALLVRANTLFVLWCLFVSCESGNSVKTVGRLLFFCFSPEEGNKLSYFIAKIFFKDTWIFWALNTLFHPIFVNELLCCKVIWRTFFVADMDIQFVFDSEKWLFRMCLVPELVEIIWMQIWFRFMCCQIWNWKWSKLKMFKFKLLFLFQI